uniref:Uncharacterized protein n=1 Tax=Anopheles merus TaxID=30066 RepID=A0A182UQD4_ANOME
MLPHPAYTKAQPLTTVLYTPLLTLTSSSPQFFWSVRVRYAREIFALSSTAYAFFIVSMSGCRLRVKIHATSARKNGYFSCSYQRPRYAYVSKFSTTGTLGHLPKPGTCASTPSSRSTVSRPTPIPAHRGMLEYLLSPSSLDDLYAQV